MQSSLVTDFAFIGERANQNLIKLGGESRGQFGLTCFNIRGRRQPTDGSHLFSGAWRSIKF